MSAEANCYPAEYRACQNNWYQQNRPSDTMFKFLNAGCWMGPADLVLQVIDAGVDFTNETCYKQDDQGLWQVHLCSWAV